jgi:integrase
MLPTSVSPLLQPIPYSQFSAQICDLYSVSSQPATLAKMRTVLDEFATLCDSTADISLHAISRWLAAPECRRRSVMTRRSLLSAFRAACGIGAQQAYCSNPFLTWDLDRWLPVPEPEELERPWLVHSGPEIARVLRRARCEAAGGPWRSQRTLALVTLAAFTGARAKELLGAQTADVDLPRGLFHIRSNPRRKLKTRSSRRTLPIHPELATVLASWLPGRGVWLIPQRSGRGPWFHGTVGYRPVDAVKQLGERVGVEGLTVLSFRHTFATLAEGWGLGELEVQRWLGHARPTTQVWYRHPRVSALAATLARIQY